MKRLLFLISLLIVFNLSPKAQSFEKQAPQGFDSLLANIPHGKIDSIMYESKTVGKTQSINLYASQLFKR